jgi:hypothetical protein
MEGCLSNPALGFLVRNIPSDPANIYGNNINYNRVSVMVFNATFNNISVSPRVVDCGFEPRLDQDKDFKE